ncbi:MAG TPA: gamma-glutamyltransferase, partial [Terriglobales bacterium]|nr:gamma-glutamyltransferase [Terriglobales bacterium]
MRRAVPTLTAALCLLAAGCPNSLARLAYDELRRPRATLDELSAEPAAASAPSAASEEPDAAAAQLVTGERIVVAAEHRDASRAGIEVAKGGGNVVDVAVATAFAVCVANPSSCGIGGGGFLVLYLARERRAVALDYREVAPQAAHRDMFVRGGKVDPNLSRRGGLAVGVPGEVAGLLAAHRAYGKLPLAKVMAPAIRFARDGVAIGAHLAETIAANVAAIRKSPPMATILLHADGRPRAAGERLQQPQLAATLSRIARDR